MSGSSFVALWPSAAAVSDLRRYCQRWGTLQQTRPSSWHLTLAFLGELRSTQRGAAFAAVNEAARASEPFALRLRGGDTFGGRQRVLFAGVSGDVAALRALAGGLAVALDARGLWRDERPFRPHLTLARRVPAKVAVSCRDDLERYRGPLWWVGEVGMYRSAAAGHGEPNNYHRVWTVGLGVEHGSGAA